MQKNIEKKDIFGNFTINILASLLLTISLQIIVYPYFASIFSVEEYGTILVIMGIYNTVVSTVGTSLNNIRLVKNDLYCNMDIRGDFNRILILALLIIIIILLTLFERVFKLNQICKLLLIFAIICGIIRSYTSVIFRINLDFKSILKSDCITSIGYIVGIYFVNKTNIWPLAFCVAELLTCIYIRYKQNILREGIYKSNIFKTTLKDYMALVITNLVMSLLIYLDRLLISPLMGNEQVAIYTVASFVGKSLSLVMVPISGVLLGYYSQSKFNMNKHLFWKINVCSFIISIVFYFITVLIAPFINTILYPEVSEYAKPYIIMANLAAVLGTISTMINPSILKYTPIKWQTIIQIIYGIMYILLGIIMIKYRGISGFCISTTICNLLRIIMLCVIGNRYIEDEVKS